MNIARFLMAATTMSLSGCALLVTRTGTDLEALKSREEVHKTFGDPIQVQQVEQQTNEKFTTHRKIAEKYKSIYYAMGYPATLGLGELIWFPTELFRASRRSILGQELHFIYDNEGKVIKVFHDGERVPLIGSPDE